MTHPLLALHLDEIRSRWAGGVGDEPEALLCALCNLLQEPVHSGAALDEQRRRARSLIEECESAPLPTWGHAAFVRDLEELTGLARVRFRYE